jgi:hypothetical protein
VRIRACVARAREAFAGLGMASATVVGLTVYVTWPQGRELSTAFAAHVDAYFSTWRLMWIAHALRADPLHLFDANIFYPATGTLAFSDATLLQGVLAAPFLMAGASPILVYNVLLLTGFAGSGLAMFALARHLTTRVAPAIIAAIVFTMAPYRIEHFMHLELQWTMFMPLTYWAIHRTVEERSWRFGLLSGICLWLQFLSSVYYGVFLSMTVAVLVPLLVLRSPRDGLRALPALIAGGVVGVVLTLPYAVPYLDNARTLGSRNMEEVLQYSAAAMNYLAAPPENTLWGWTSDRWGTSERRMFPGLVALGLASAAFLRRPRKQAWIYAVLTLFAAEMSLGLRGILYPWLFEHLEGLRGLRAPARFAILVQCGLATLAAFGLREVQDRISARSTSLAVAILLAIALVGEYSNRPLALEQVRPPETTVSNVYGLIGTLAPGAVIELPMPTLSTLPGHEATYAFWSAGHWRKLVNGYSGYYPHVYMETVNAMETFPDTESIARLRRMDVRYIVVHHAFYDAARLRQLLDAMLSDAALEPVSATRDPVGPATLFAIRQTGRSGQTGR